MNKIVIGGLMPIEQVNHIARQKILATLKKYSFEEQLFALILWKMIKELDEPTQRLKYIQRNLKKLAKINAATRYVKSIIDATNRVWIDSFKELTFDVSIAGFCKAIVFRREDMFKKMGIRLDDFIKLDKLHGANDKTMATLKVINLMFKKAEGEVEIEAIECQKFHDSKKDLT